MTIFISSLLGLTLGYFHMFSPRVFNDIVDWFSIDSGEDPSGILIIGCFVLFAIAVPRVGTGNFFTESFNLSAITAGIGFGYIVRFAKAKVIHKLDETDKTHFKQQPHYDYNFEYERFSQESFKTGGRQWSNYEPVPKPCEKEKHLGVLGLNLAATQQEIKKSYRQLARIYHPDIIRGKGGTDAQNAEAECKMKDINAAYAWLMQYG